MAFPLFVGGVSLMEHGIQRPVVHRRSTETRYDPNELKQICLIINTADYCQTTAAEVRFLLYGIIE